MENKLGFGEACTARSHCPCVPLWLSSFPSGRQAGDTRRWQGVSGDLWRWASTESHLCLPHGPHNARLGTWTRRKLCRLSVSWSDDRVARTPRAGLILERADSSQGLGISHSGWSWLGDRAVVMCGCLPEAGHLPSLVWLLHTASSEPQPDLQLSTPRPPAEM